MPIQMLAGDSLNSFFKPRSEENLTPSIPKYAYSTLSVFFCQIKSFIRFRLAFVFWAPDPLMDKFY